MTWTNEQRARLALEYTRIRYQPGERWPAPPEHLTPDDLLALFRTVPDGAGRAGYLGKFRDECLSVHWFRTIAEAQREVEAWRQDFNERRPHRGLNALTPGEFTRALQDQPTHPSPHRLTA